MAPLPPLNPPPPEAPGARVPVRTRSVIPEEISGSGPAEIVLAKLRSMIAGGKQETDTILGTIAVAAHALTGATGAAIAMPRNGEVVWLGRSGDIAPQLGDRLNVDSGISGECLRTGRIMRCDDAGGDFHVDPEICRQLNLQSIAVVPLRGQHGRVGVLEVFSSQSRAFSDENMELLGRLAGLAETAWAQGVAETQGPETQELGPENLQAQEFQTAPPPPATPAPTEALEQSPRLAEASVALTRVGEALATGLHAELRAERMWRYGTIAGLATVFLVLLGVLSWKAWYRASLPVSSTRPAGTSQDAVPANSDAVAGAGSAWEGAERSHLSPKPTPAGRKSAITSTTAPATASELTTAADSPDTVIRRPLVPKVSGRANAATPPDPGSNAVDAPQIPAPGGRPTDLESLFSASPVLPRLEEPIARGVAGGILVHKVLPVYPSEARQAHVQGTVVLEATVTERGQVENLKVVSGPPILAEAAIEAVRKWRYTPNLLDGKLVRKQTQISITFIP